MMSSLDDAGLHIIRLEVDWVVRVEIAERAGVSRQVVSQWTAEDGGYDFPENSDLFIDGIWFWPDVEHWLVARGKIEAPEGRHLTLSQCNQINASLGQEVDPILRIMRRSGRPRGEFSIASLSRSLTLQQGARILGVALPALVNLLNSGRIPSQGQHVHRRVNLLDVLSYREARKARRHRAIASTGDYGIVEDSRIVTARMRKARQVVSPRRRSQSESLNAVEDS